MAEIRKYNLGQYEVEYREENENQIFKEWWIKLWNRDEKFLRHFHLDSIVSMYLTRIPYCDSGYKVFSVSCDEMRKELNQFMESIWNDMNNKAIELDLIDSACVNQTMIDTEEKHQIEVT